MLFRSLESLWLVGDTASCTEDILLSISSLPRLKSLVLDTWSEFLDEFNVAQQMELPKSLKSVASFDTMDWPLLSRLMCPRGDHCVTNLHLTLRALFQLEGDPDAVERFNQYISLLETLSISSGSATECAIHNHSLHRILSRARSLRRFSLLATKLHVRHLHLPDTVTVFHFHHERNTPKHYLGTSKHFLVKRDKCLASTILVSCPIMPTEPAKSSLREVILSFMRDKRDFDTDTLTLLKNKIFAKTYTACRSAGVELTFKTYACPYFGPLAEEDPFI